MPNLTFYELKQVAKMRRIKGYNNMSKEMSLSVLEQSESLDNAKIRKIKEDSNKLRDRFLKPLNKRNEKKHL